MLRVVAPFYAFRGLVMASPVWYPALSDTVRQRILAFVLAVLWLLGLLAWAVWGLWELALAISLANRVFYSHYKSPCQKMIGAEEFVREFALLPIILKRMEQEDFASGKLVGLQSQLRKQGVSAAASIRKLSRSVQALESRRSLLITVSDPFLLWTTQVALAVEAWRQKFAPAFRNEFNEKYKDKVFSFRTLLEKVD